MLDIRASADTTVASTMVGAEAFADHHICRAESMGISLVVGGEPKAVDYAVEISLADRLTKLMPVLLDEPKPTCEPWRVVFRRIQGHAALQSHAKFESRGTKGLDRRCSSAQRIDTGEYRGAAEIILPSPDWLATDRIAALTAKTDEPEPGSEPRSLPRPPVRSPVGLKVPGRPLSARLIAGSMKRMFCSSMGFRFGEIAELMTDTRGGASAVRTLR